MINKISKIFPTQSLIFFLICSAGILVFIFLIILPSQNTAADLDKNIEELKARIDEQRILTPVFHSLLARAKGKNPTELPLTQKTKSARGEVKNISSQIKKIAQGCGLHLAEITPDVNSLKQSSGYLSMNIIVTGDFFNFRKFLIELGSIPSLESIQEIKIRPIEESREIKLKIWLAQE